MGLVAVGLLGFGTGGFGGSRVAIGSVGGEEIVAQDYANALGGEVRRVEDQLGQPLDGAQVAALGLDRAVLAQLVAERALDAEAARLGLSVGDARVAAAVRASPAFQGLDGGFDRELYREQLARAGLDAGGYEDALRADSARALLQGAVIGALPEPAAQADLLAEWAGERRTVTWAPLPADAVSVPEPTEAEARAFHDANPDAFTAPELREISYAWITPEMLAPGLDVPEAEVRALYDERRAEFVQPERRLVERLVLPDEAAAAEARRRLDAGEATFEALVEGRGLQLSDIDLGDATREDLGAAAEGVFAATPGEVAGPLPTGLGPALFRVNAVLAADEVSLEEAAPDLRAEIADGLARAAIDAEVAALDDLLAGGATVEDVAERTALEPGTIAYAEGATEGIAAYDAFRAAAAAAQEGAFPAVERLPDGGAFVLRLDAVTPPALRPFAEVAAEAAAQARAQALAEARRAEAQRLAAAVAGGASFEAEGLAPATEPPITRRDVVEGTPPGFAEAAFGLAPGEAAAIGDAVVLRLDAVAPASGDDPGVAADRAARARQISGQIASDLYAAYAAAVQTGIEVRIDEAAVAAVAAQVR